MTIYRVVITKSLDAFEEIEAYSREAAERIAYDLAATYDYTTMPPVYTVNGEWDDARTDQ
jgi:hypothetical protein